jgi:hypothetical protein
MKEKEEEIAITHLLSSWSNKPTDHPAVAQSFCYLVAHPMYIEGFAR